MDKTYETESCGVTFRGYGAGRLEVTKNKVGGGVSVRLAPVVDGRVCEAEGLLVSGDAFAVANFFRQITEDVDDLMVAAGAAKSLGRCCTVHWAAEHLVLSVKALRQFFGIGLKEALPPARLGRMSNLKEEQAAQLVAVFADYGIEARLEKS